MKKENTRSIRYSEEDDLLIAAIQAATGIRAIAEVYRMGLRAMAEKLAIKLPPTK